MTYVVQDAHDRALAAAQLKKEGRTLAEISATFEVSRARAGQLVSKGLWKIERQTTSDLWNGDLPANVCHALVKAGYRSRLEVRDSISSGSLSLQGIHPERTTVPGLGPKGFVLLCTCLEVAPPAS